MKHKNPLIFWIKIKLKILQKEIFRLNNKSEFSNFPDDFFWLIHKWIDIVLL